MIGSSPFYEKKKQSAVAKLSLVSLMDIFTILVFFLLLNSGESQKLENAKFVQLPDSSSGIAPHTELQIVISDEEIFLGEQIVARVADVVKSSDRIIPALAEELEASKAQLKDLSNYEQHEGLAVTISGDRSVSFSLLKTVMATCQHSNYRNISLAVNRIVGPNLSEPKSGPDLKPESEPAPEISEEADSSLVMTTIGSGD